MPRDENILDLPPTDDIPIGQESLAQADFNEQIRREFEQKMLGDVADVVQCFSVAAETGDAEGTASLRKPGKKILRAFALLRKFQPDIFENEIEKLRSGPLVDGFLLDRFLDAVAFFERDIADLKLEMANFARKRESSADQDARRRRELEKAARETVIYCHGTDGEKYYFSSTSKPQLTEIAPRAFSPPLLCSFAILEYWELKFGEKKDEDPTSRPFVNWNAVYSFLMNECNKKGHFDPSKFRGRGFFAEGERFLFNTGKELILEGGLRLGIDENPGDFIYSPGPEIVVADDALHTEERAQLLSIIDRFTFEEPIHARFVTGWILMTVVAGALPFKSIMWMTAAAGSGKTLFVEQFASKLLGSAAHYVKHSTTDRGLAQKVGRDSIIFLFEEAEVNDEPSRIRMGKILTALRGGVTKSSASRVVHGSETKLDTTGAFFSINDCIIETADLSRSVRPRLRKPTFEEIACFGTGDAFRDFITEFVTPELSARFLAFGIQNLRAIRETIIRFERVLAPIVRERRHEENFGTILGCAYFLEFATIPSETQIAEWMKLHSIARSTLISGADDRTDAEKVIEILFQSRVQIIDGSNASRGYTISDLLSAALVPGVLGDRIDPAIAKAALERRGIKIDAGNRRVMIASGARCMLDIFEKTAFGKNFFHSLKPLMDENDKRFARTLHYAGIGKVHSLPIKFEKIMGFLGQVENGEADMPMTPEKDLAKRMLEKMFQTQIPTINSVGHARRDIVRDLITCARRWTNNVGVNFDDAENALSKVGIRLCQDEGRIAIAVDHVTLSDLLGRGGSALGKKYWEILDPLVVDRLQSVDFNGIEKTAIVVSDPAHTKQEERIFERDVAAIEAAGANAKNSNPVH